jgi:hypothetical protein
LRWHHTWLLSAGWPQASHLMSLNMNFHSVKWV